MPTEKPIGLEAQHTKMEGLLGPEERVAALYSRVIHRVCQRLVQQRSAADGETREEEEAARERLEEAAARVEQRWRERLTCYTGYTYASLVPTVESSDEFVARESASGDVPIPQPVTVTATATDKAEVDEHPETASGGVGNPSLAAMGRPSALMEQVTPSSVFAKMFNAKRKIDQLDGTTDYDEDAMDQPRNDSSSEALHGGAYPDEAKDEESGSLGPRPIARTATEVSSALVSSTPTPTDVAHVTSLNITRFPLQCSAQDVNFTFKKGLLRGKWKNAVITLLRRVNRLERIAPGHVLWLIMPSNDVGLRETSRSSTGRVVEVVEPPGPDGSLVVRVGRQDGLTLNVHVTDTRRFHELLVADCNAHFQFLAS